MASSSTRAHRKSAAGACATLTPDAWSAFFGLIASGTPRTRPVGPAWQDTYGALLLEWRRSTGLAGQRDPNGPPHDAEQVLYGIPAEVTLSTRSRWPEDVPVYVGATWRTWWPMPPGPSVVVRPRLDAPDTHLMADC